MPDGYDVHKVNEIGHMYEYIMSLTLGMLGHFRKKKIDISKRVCVCFFRYTIRVSNSLGPDQA